MGIWIVLVSLTISLMAEAQTPVGYFTFASDANIVLRQDLSSVVGRVGSNFMVGGDSGYPFVSQEFVRVMRKADSFGAKKHVYLEGPGGPTGSGGIAGDECQRMIERARRVGIPIDRNNCSSSAKWIRTWNSTGWWDSTILEIQHFHDRYAISSVEIDNLYRAGVESAGSVVRFLQRFQTAMAAKNLPVTLLLKNIDVDGLNAIKSAIEAGQVQRAYLTDFAISEEDFRSNWPAIKRASKRIGIVTLTSSNTYNYQAKGYWQ